MRTTTFRATALRAAGFGLLAVVVLSGCAPANEPIVSGSKVSVPAPDVASHAPKETQAAAPAQPAPGPAQPAKPAATQAKAAQPAKPAATQAQPTKPAATQAQPAQPVQTRPEPKLSEERAQGIALNHARVSGNTPIYCDLDYEDDLPRANPEWDCEFVASEHEYSYEIDAVTGKIVNYEKESVWD